MKNLYSFLFAFCFFNLVGAQIVNIPDINFKNKLLQATYDNEIALDQFGNSIRIDNNNDGEIQNSECVIIRELNLYDCGISNLTGIQAFLYLNKLDCSYNALTSLDVSSLTYLLRLKCNNNQLASLNVSGLTFLQQLSCSNNLLTTLNVTGITDLHSLGCSGNLLTSLDVSGHSNLYWVYFSNNQVSNFVYNNSPNITYLECNNNLLSGTLDLSSLHNLLTLSCNNNALTYLNINGTNLTRVYCNHNLLTTIDVSGLAGLRVLDCSYNLLTGTNSGIVFPANNSQLVELNFNNNLLQVFNYSSPTLAYIGLTGNPTLTEVNLSGCPIVNDIDRTETLDLSNCHLTSLNLNSGVLRTVKCNNNMLTNLTLYGTALKELNCSNNLLTNLSVYALPLTPCSAVPAPPCGGLQSLDCSNNLLTSLTIIGETNYNNLYKIVINCNQNQFSTLDFSTIKHIRSLDFGNNPNLTWINLKNTTNENALFFSNTPLLQNICEDAAQVTEVQNAVALYGYNNCSVSSTCAFLSSPNFEENNTFKIFPNPVNDFLNIETNDSFHIKEIIVYNTLGQVVLVSDSIDKKLAVSNLKSGTYFMVIHGNQMNIRKTFIKL